MLNLKKINRSMFFIVMSLCFAEIAYANSSQTLGSITQQRGMLEDLNLQVQIQEQSQKLTQLLTPVIPVAPNNAGELTAKQLMEKLEVPKQSIENSEEKSSKKETFEDNNSSTRIIAIYSNTKILQAKVKINGKSHLLKNGQVFNGQKVQIFRDKVIIGKRILEL